MNSSNLGLLGQREMALLGRTLVSRFHGLNLGGADASIDHAHFQLTGSHLDVWQHSDLQIVKLLQQHPKYKWGAHAPCKGTTLEAGGTHNMNHSGGLCCVLRASSLFFIIPPPCLPFLSDHLLCLEQSQHQMLKSNFLLGAQLNKVCDSVIFTSLI